MERIRDRKKQTDGQIQTQESERGRDVKGSLIDMKIKTKEIFFLS